MIIKEKHYPVIIVLIVIIFAYELDTIFFSKKTETKKAEQKIEIPKRTPTQKEIKKKTRDSDKKRINYLLGKLNSAAPIDRRKALLSLKRYVKYPRAAQGIVNQLNDTDKKNREIVLDIMSDNYMVNYLFALIRFIKKEKDPILQYKSEKILTKMGKLKVLDQELYQLMGEQNIDTVRIAASVLMKVYKPSYGYPLALERGLNSPHADVRRTLLQFLKTMPKENLIQFLGICEQIKANDPDTTCRKLASHIISKSNN